MNLPPVIVGALLARAAAVATRAISAAAAAVSAAVVAATMVLLGAPAPAAAQDWPSRPVTVVVPFPPGGGTDVVARLLASKLAPRLGQPVVIENKPGAASTIGAAAVAKAAPDGYTLLLSGSSTYSIVPALKTGLPYDPLQSYALIGVVAKAPLLLLAGTAAPFGTVAGLVQRAKDASEPLMYATFGPGSGPHLAGVLLAHAAQARLSPVPYKGSAPALTGLIGGEVPFGFDTVAAGVPHVRSGRLKALAITGDKRSPLLPDVPTYAEAGIGAASLVSWYGLAAPAKTPDAVVERLAKELAAVMTEPDVRQALTDAGLAPVQPDRRAFRQLINDELPASRALAHRGRITLD